jgi:hypothetical protein
VFGDYFGARAQPKMKGIAQYDLRAYFVKLVGHHGFDGAIGANRHKDWGLDHTVIERHASASRQTIGSE